LDRFILRGYLNEKMQKLVFLIVGLCLALVFVAGCSDSTPTPVTPEQTLTPLVKSTVKTTVNPTVKITTVAAQEDFTLVESHVETGDYGTRYVVGTIKSNVNKQFSYAQVTINEYDSSGAQIGSTMANVNNLEPHATWKFKAPILEKSAVDFKVMKFTAF
jgi:uncharacterized protein YcfL